MQLDLFEHAPRHYHEAQRRLGRLDLSGCREALARHRAEFPRGADPGPVERAAAWLEARVPRKGDPLGAVGAEILALCRVLRAGGEDVPERLKAGTDTARQTIGSLARWVLELLGPEGFEPVDPVVPDLPWGVFHLFAGAPAEARRALLGFLATHDPSAAGYLALGEACAAVGRDNEAARVWREGYGLDPAGAGWAPTAPWIDDLRTGFVDVPLLGADWWVVGAYLDGRFPRYTRAPSAVVARRWRRFVVGGEGVAASVRFFEGLFLSEQGDLLPLDDLVAVRRTLRDLHPEAYELHRERLEELGPPRAAP